MVGVQTRRGFEIFFARGGSSKLQPVANVQPQPRSQLPRRVTIFIRTLAREFGSFQFGRTLLEFGEGIFWSFDAACSRALVRHFWWIWCGTKCNPGLDSCNFILFVSCSNWFSDFCLSVTSLCWLSEGMKPVFDDDYIFLWGKSFANFQNLTFSAAWGHSFNQRKWSEPSVTFWLWFF